MSGAREYTRAEQDASVVGLGATFLNPSRGREAEVREAVGRSRDRRAVWERLNARGLIPDAWVESDERRFAREPIREFAREPIRENVLARYDSAPTTIEGAVTLASDVPGVELAEASAREWHHRTSLIEQRGRLRGVVWRVLPITSKLWRGVELERDLQHLQAASELGVFDSQCSLLEREVARSRVTRVRDAFMSSLARRFGVGSQQRVWSQVNHYAVAMIRAAIGALLAFDDASRHGGPVKATWRTSKMASGSTFADFKNPVAPLMSVYQAGYAAHGIVATGEGDWVVLSAAALKASAMPASTRGRS